MKFLKKLPSLKGDTKTLKILGEPGPAAGTSGVQGKPSTCGECKFCNVGTGFMSYEPDMKAQIGFLFGGPSKEDILLNVPWSGGTGYVRKKFTKQRSDFKKITSTALYLTRCMPPFWSMKPGKSHPAHGQGAKTCERLYGSYKSFAPDIVMLTYEPLETMNVGAYTRQLEKDVDKAVRFCEAGYRVLVALGDKAALQVAPFIQGKGGLPAWHGHWWEYE